MLVDPISQIFFMEILFSLGNNQTKTLDLSVFVESFPVNGVNHKHSRVREKGF